MSTKVMAIVGCGPRGLAALEKLFKEVSEKKPAIALKVVLFDSSKYLGTGKSWELDQPDANWINISDHALQNLEGRIKISFDSFSIASFPSYRDWCISNDLEKDSDKDEYPPRSVMGAYLNERFKSIFNILQKKKLASHISENIINIKNAGEKLELISTEKSYLVDDCLLSIGHQPTEVSEESQAWIEHANHQECVYIHHPYEVPVSEIHWNAEAIGIKGFGLSMIDISRMLTSSKGGEFVKNTKSKFLTYKNGGNKLKIVPFSLDGLPVVPKPLGRKEDSIFEPSIRQKKQFVLEINNHLAEAEKIEDEDFLISAFATIAAEIFLKQVPCDTKNKFTFNDIKGLTEVWLRDEEIKHDLILDTSMPVRDYMKRTVEMAFGEASCSLDYAVGQIWRHLQPSMYRLFAHTSLKAKVLKKIVELDERTKRYSYGPPVESILQLIALIDAGILETRFLNNPEVKMLENGWHLEKAQEEIGVNMMINSILAGPDFQKMNSELMLNLKKQFSIKQVESNLGIATRPDATVILNEPQRKLALAVLGRNAKGNILGTDAILECFSPEIESWARAAVQRLSDTTGG